MCACWSIRWTWSTFEQLKKSFVLRKFVCFEVAYFYLSCQPNELCIVIMILWNYCTVIRILFYASHWPYVVIIKIRQFLFVVCCSDTTSAQRSHLPFEIVQRPKPSCLHLQANQRLLHLVHKHRRLASTFCVAIIFQAAALWQLLIAADALRLRTQEYQFRARADIRKALNAHFLLTCLAWSYYAGTHRGSRGTLSSVKLPQNWKCSTSDGLIGYRFLLKMFQDFAIVTQI